MRGKRGSGGLNPILNAIQRRDVVNVGRLLFAMLDDVLTELAFLNERPYASASWMLAEAQALPKRPRCFADVAAIAIDGGYTDLRRTRLPAQTVFAGLEELFFEEGVALCGSELVLPASSQ